MNAKNFVLLTLFSQCFGFEMQKLFDKQVRNCQLFVQGSYFDLGWLNNYANVNTTNGTYFAIPVANPEIGADAIFFKFCEQVPIDTNTEEKFAVFENNNQEIAQLGGGEKTPGRGLSYHIIFQDRDDGKKGKQRVGMNLTYFDEGNKTDSYLPPTAPKHSSSLSIALYCDANLTADPQFVYPDVTINKWFDKKGRTYYNT